MATNGITFKIKIDVHILPKPTRVIISVCFSITECLQDTVRLQQDIFYSEINRSDIDYLGLTTLINNMETVTIVLTKMTSKKLATIITNIFLK